MDIPASITTELDQTVEEVLASWKIPGIAVCVVKDDEVLLARGYGVRELGRPEAVDEHTLFAIASNTKAFTAAAVGMLVQEGKLDWDDPVSKYLPWFRLYDAHATGLMTVRDLLCHRAGLGTWAGDMLQFSTYPPREVLERVRHIEPAYPFRAGYGYSNLMFIAAGMVVEAVSGMSWDDFIRERLFTPLGFGDSVTAPMFFGTRTNIAAPHEEYEGEVRKVGYREDAGFGAAGSICGSVADLSRWLRMQLNGGQLEGKQILDPAILEETHTAQTLIRMLPEDQKMFPMRHITAYGLGWFMNDHDGRLMIRHTGGLDGMLSSTVMLPEERLGVVVLTNKLPNMGYLALSYHLIDRMRGVEGPDWFEKYREYEKNAHGKLEDAKKRLYAARVNDTHPSLPLEAFAGEYEAPVIGKAVIEAEGEGLHIHLKAHPSLTGVLSHWHYDSFMCKWDDPALGESLIPFTGDGQGHITGFKVTIREDWIDPLSHVFSRKADHEID